MVSEREMDHPTFDKALVRLLLEKQFKNDTAPLEKTSKKTKLQDQTLAVSGEFLRLFTQEAVRRAQAQAALEGHAVVTPAHLQLILPQLLLDF